MRVINYIFMFLFWGIISLIIFTIYIFIFDKPLFDEKVKFFFDDEVITTKYKDNYKKLPLPINNTLLPTDKVINERVVIKATELTDVEKVSRKDSELSNNEIIQLLPKFIAEGKKYFTLKEYELYKNVYLIQELATVDKKTKKAKRKPTLYVTEYRNFDNVKSLDARLGNKIVNNLTVGKWIGRYKLTNLDDRKATFWNGIRKVTINYRKQRYKAPAPPKNNKFTPKFNNKDIVIIPSIN